MNRKSFALVSSVVLAATSFAIPSSANSVDIHQISTQDTPQLLAQGKGRDKDKQRGRGRDRNRERTNAQISGIKWQTGAGFTQGEFTVTLSGQVTTGVVNVAAKGPDVVRGAIAGPSCPLR